MSHEHGEHDPAEQKWFCGYWMSQDEWMDVHDYAPVVKKQQDSEEQED
jgi:hypothetical protein